MPRPFSKILALHFTHIRGMNVPWHAGHGEPILGHVEDVDVAIDVAGLDDVLVVVEVVGGLNVFKFVFFVGFD